MDDTEQKQKPKKQVIKKIVKEVSESEEEEEEVIQEVIIKKKSNKQKDILRDNPTLTQSEKMNLVHQTAEERLKKSLKEERINFLLNQIGAKL